MPTAASPVLIVGVHRSKTSMIAAGYAEKCWTGTTSAPAEGYPRGNMENPRLKDRFTKAFLNPANGLTNLPEKPFEAGFTKSDVLEEIESQGYSGGPWMFKDTKILHAWPVWERELDPIWVKVRRKREDILSSFARCHWMAHVRSEWDHIIDVYEKRLSEVSGEEIWI